MLEAAGFTMVLNGGGTGTPEQWAVVSATLERQCNERSGSGGDTICTS